MRMGSEKEIPIFTLNEKMKKQFKETRNLLDGILETFGIFEDPEAMDRIQISEKELREGKNVGLEDLKKELSLD